MTAVEFIAQELSKQIDNNLFMEVTFNKLLAQAKDIELKNLLSAQSEAYLRGYNDGQKSNL